MWLSHNDFKRLTTEIWGQNLDSDPLKNFLAISGSYAKVLKTWNKNVFGDLFKKLKDLQEESSLIQQQLMNSPFSVVLQEKNAKVKSRIA